MKDWWYSVQEEMRGPVEKEELEELFNKRKITPGTLVWKEGMENWTPLKVVEELDFLHSETKKPGIKTLQKQYPWRRYFARSFDLFLEGFLIVFCVAFFFEDFITWCTEDRVRNAIFGLILNQIALILDGLIQGVFGNTPGKALLGITLKHTSGRPLTVSETLHRNFSLLSKGFAYFTPIFSLITLVYQYRRLRSGKPASYDEGRNISYHVRPIGWARKGAFAALFLISCTGWLFFQTFSNEDEQLAQTSAESTLPPLTAQADS